MLVWGIISLLVFTAIFVIGAIVEGSGLRAWRMFSGSAGPEIAHHPVVGYVLSVSGYLVVPALIGAIVLEDLDLLVDCTNQRLVPRDPKYVVSEIE